MVYMETTAGSVLLASDAVHFYEELERDMPFTAVSDLPAMYAAFSHIREQADVHRLIVISGHDRDVLTRFAPCGGARAGIAVTVGGASRR